jgi:hypothetical protein
MFTKLHLGEYSWMAYVDVAARYILDFLLGVYNTYLLDFASLMGPDWSI